MAYSTIPKGNLYFNTKLYSGTGSSQSITGFGFQPDFVWIKCRSGTYATEEHNLFDSVRGTTKFLRSSSNSAELTDTNSLSAFNSDGFTVVSRDSVNGSSSAYASWNWKAATYGATYYSKVEGGTQSNSDTASAIGITAGSNGSNTWRVAVNRDSNFSIVKYVGTGSNATVGHGLGVAPKMVIVKKISGTSQWYTYHASLGATKYLDLQSAAAESTSSANWNNTAPTTTVFSLGTNSNVNASGQTYIAYCFAEVKGFSKVSKYIGNGNSDGTFVYTGFKPAFVLIKNLFVSASWQIQDNKRLGYNVNESSLFPDTNGAEGGGKGLDILSNGFKLRSTSGVNNSSGGTFGYIAFASNPFVATSGTTAVPVTAR